MKSYTPSKAVREAERELREIIRAINAQKRKLRAVARRLHKAASSAEQAWTNGEDRYTVEDWLASSVEAAESGEIDLRDVWTTGAAARRNLLEYLESMRQRELEHGLAAARIEQTSDQPITTAPTPATT